MERPGIDFSHATVLFYADIPEQHCPCYSPDSGFWQRSLLHLTPSRIVSSTLPEFGFIVELGI